MYNFSVTEANVAPELKTANQDSKIPLLQLHSLLSSSLASWCIALGFLGRRRRWWRLNDIHPLVCTCRNHRSSALTTSSVSSRVSRLDFNSSVMLIFFKVLSVI